MIPELAHMALWLAAVCALFQIGLAIGIVRNGEGHEQQAAAIRAVRVLSIGQAVLCLGAFFALIWLFMITDLSVKLVVSHSHSEKPMLYKITGTWGNHEGSMLLWVAVLTASGALLALFDKALSRRMLAATLGAQACLAIGFFLFLLLASNPFARLDPLPIEGVGLNPLLQDPGLAFHPPTLYIGYVGLSIAFSFAVAALVLRDAGPAFARAMRPWVLLSWVFLTIGITAGSYWAYYELGWGGWWFWDPVENASLMPWLAATALLHSASVTAKRDALRAWTLILALIGFASSILGTFIVRSGLLTSVHAFAVDPTRGTFILVLMAFYVGGAFLLFGLRIGAVTEGKKFALFSRESALVLNNLLLSSILAIVAFGTLYPIAAEAMGEKISVGPPYFNAATAPFMFAIMLALLIGPSLRWRKDGFARISKGAVFGIGLMLFAGAMLLWRIADMGWLSLVALALAAALAVASFYPLVGRNLLRTPLPVWGMVVAHFGIAVALVGMASDAAFTRETLAAVKPGQTVSVGAWRVKLDDVFPREGDNWTAIEARLSVSRPGSQTVMSPQSRTFIQPQTETNEAALYTVWDGQLYAVLGQPDAAGRWQLRLWWKPFVTLIWFGGLLLSLGGLLALLGHSGWIDAARRWRNRPRAAKGYDVRGYAAEGAG